MGYRGGFTLPLTLAAGLTIFSCATAAHDDGLPLGDGHLSGGPRVGYL